MRRTTLCLAVAALGLGTIGAGTAHADGHDRLRPIIEQYDDQFAEVDPFLTELCGFDVHVDGRFQGTVRLWGDGGFHVTERGTVVLSNTETGKTLTRFSRLNLRGQGTETVDDGILTIVFDETYTGIPERWFDAEGKEVIKDRGYARFVGEVVVDLGDPDDPEDDEVLHLQEEVTTRGPHPIVETGFDLAEACALLS